MNEFEYVIHLQKIKDTKYVKDLEVLIRKYSEKLPKGYFTELNKNDMKIYKLLVFSLNIFSKKSSKILPDFIYKRQLFVQQKLLEQIFESSNMSYKEFIDLFEFDKKLNLPSSHFYIEELNKIIQNNSIHFTIKFNYRKRSFDNYSTDLPYSDQILLYAIRYKQVNFPNKAQTVWDLFIKDCQSNVSKLPSNIEENVIKLKQQIKALKTLGEYIE